MKKTILKSIVTIAILVITLTVTLIPSMAAAYSTYTYSIDGTQLASPGAYEPDAVWLSADMGIDGPTGFALGDPQDVTVDSDGNVYLIDIVTMKDSNDKICRLIVLDQYFKYKSHIQGFINESGSEDNFDGAKGVSVTDKYVYVADTGRKRIVIFNREDVISRRVDRLENGRDTIQAYNILGKPQADIFKADDEFDPIAVASNDNHIYVVCQSVYMGIISMNMAGEFQGYVGAQKVSASALDLFWRMFQSDEDRALQAKYVPTEYNNLVMDEKGFIYATIIITDKAAQQKAITSKSTSAEFAPVKKLNTNGDDILNRTGFFPPSGEVMIATKAYSDSQPTGPSEIIDVAVGPEGSWSIIDKNRKRIFTYDKNGNLLFAFGDKGTQLGNLQSITAITYQPVKMDDGKTTHKMVVLDNLSKSINVYKRTDYGDLLIDALKCDNERRFSESVDYYTKILSRNNNFDTAYIGMAKSYYRSGMYEEAMDQYSYAYNTNGYSQAFKMFRKDWVAKYIWVVPIVVVVVFGGLYFFFKYARKVNDKTAITSGKRTFVQEILFAFHLMFHPFDGFWDLKHEKRGSLRGAAFWIGIAVLVFTYQSIGRSYMYNPRGTFSSVWVQLASVCVPLALFATANWCITTLFDGEGSIKDIVIATGYSLAPLPLMIIPATLLTHILSASESGIINLFNSFAFVWLGLLLFFGVMITHDYPLVKNFVTVLVTIVGMAIIMFIIILFATLVSDMYGLVNNIVTEISYRM